MALDLAVLVLLALRQREPLGGERRDVDAAAAELLASLLLLHGAVSLSLRLAQREPLRRELGHDFLHFIDVHHRGGGGGVVGVDFLSLVALSQLVGDPLLTQLT